MEANQALKWTRTHRGVPCPTKRATSANPPGYESKGKGNKKASKAVTPHAVRESQWPANTTKTPSSHVLAFRPRGRKPLQQMQSPFAIQQARSNVISYICGELPSYQEYEDAKAPGDDLFDFGAASDDSDHLSAESSPSLESMLNIHRTEEYTAIAEINQQASLDFSFDYFDFEAAASTLSVANASMSDTTSPTLASPFLNPDVEMQYNVEPASDCRIRKLEAQLTTLSLAYTAEVASNAHKDNVILAQAITISEQGECIADLEDQLAEDHHLHVLDDRYGKKRRM